MTEPLSPAAQTALWEVLDRDSNRLVIAAALRAAADRLPLSRGYDNEVYRSVRHLLAIAAELEGAE
jgi:hypothetical protein